MPQRKRPRPAATAPAQPDAASDAPIRVAVIGGGCAALTAAYELSRPEHKGRYQVTVYQMGWRLGGKGASGRGVADRIEEHGLHLWMGHYENSFRMIRECYDALAAAGVPRRFARWDDAFSPARYAGVCDVNAQGKWDVWVAHFPPMRGLPGDPGNRSETYSVLTYVRQSVVLLGELLRSAHGMDPIRRPVPASGQRDEARGVGEEPLGVEAAASALETVVRYGQLASAAALFEATDVLRQAMVTWMPQMLRDSAEVLLRLIEALAAATRRALEKVTEGDRALRRTWQAIDLVLATLRGVVFHGLAFDPRGFDAVNEYDSCEWLRLHGATEGSLNSGFMRGMYDLAFAFEDGDVRRPRLAAGVGLRGSMRMFFSYRGSLFWRMNAGMGDVVFAPMYEVLKRRGVRFEFFHRVRNLRLSPERKGETPYVQALELDVQARVKGGVEYAPLVDVRGMPCWPSTPDYDQLEDGAALRAEGRDFEGHWEQRRAARRTLTVGSDFDFVVLGVGLGAVPHVASELVARDAKWRAMVRHVKTVPTQTFQLWMRENVDDLGWNHHPVNVAAFAPPFDTWADMRHLIPEESWTKPVKAIAYFCGVLPDDLPPGAEVTEEFFRLQRAKVRDNAVDFLERHVGALWPGAVRSERGGGFRWDLLVAEESASAPRAGPRRFDSQYLTANVNPSDRYVLVLPGSVKYRISPLDLTFDNLTIAGDWTHNGLETGCIESAVMSGRLAAHALSRKPALEDIVGYDHP
jgi:uncharacterized protein with NAD-binding domain and iron-sulfur cluster